MDWHHEQLVGAIRAFSGDKKQLHQFLELILTEKEYDGIARRLEILRALYVGRESHRTIADRLEVSIATVTRMSNIMKQDNEFATRSIQRMLSNR
jgi:TrpR family transcriptional regulator, trp operon repressor